MTEYITISQQLLSQSQANEKAWTELNWIALNYEKATPDQQARWNAWQENFDRLASEGYFD